MMRMMMMMKRMDGSSLPSTYLTVRVVRKFGSLQDESSSTRNSFVQLLDVKKFLRGTWIVLLT